MTNSWFKITNGWWSVFRDRPPVIIAFAMMGFCLYFGDTNAVGSGFSSLGHRALIVYTEGERSGWNLHQSFLETEYSFKQAGLDWIAGIRHSEPSGDFRWGYFGKEHNAPANPEDSDGGRLSGRIYLFEPNTRATILARLSNKTAFCRGEIGYRGDDKTEYSATVGIRPHKYLGMELGHGRFYPFPSYSELYFDPYKDDGPIGYEGGRLNWDMPASQTYLKLTASYAGKLKAAYRYNHVSLRTDQPNYGDFPMESYTAELYGGWDLREASMTFIPVSGWNNELKYSELILDCDSLTAHDGGLKFAYFGIIEGSGHMWTYSATYRQYVLNINLGRAEGSAQGTVQAWPFLRGLYHFLGERRHFIAEGTVHWFYTSIGSRLWEKSWLNINGGLSYLRVQPEMDYVTWRPFFMGMGADDLRSGSLDLQRADLIRLQVKPQIKWSYLVFSADISQWIPVDTRKASDGAQGGGGSGGDGSETGSDKQNIWGGFSASLIITATF